MERLKKYTIVIAEEKETIQRLIQKAVDTKPLGREKISKTLLVTNEDELFEAIHPKEDTILLLSTSFSTRSHKELVQKTLSQSHSVYVLSLSNKYGDRSSLDFGAVESVDKPIRNPVLWEKLDRTITYIEENGMKEKEEPPEYEAKQKTLFQEDDITLSPDPVIHPESKVIEEEEVAPTEKPSLHSPVSNSSDLVVISEEEEDDDDYDIFGSTIRTTPSKPSSPIKEELTVEKEEDVESPKNELETTKDGLRPESVINVEDVVIRFNNPNEDNANEDLGVLIDLEDTETEADSDEKVEVSDDRNTETKMFAFEVEEEEDLNEISKDNSENLPTFEFEESTDDVVETTTLGEVDAKNWSIEEESKNEVESLDDETTEETLEQPSADLEPISEINAETSIYNEKSEWTLANEGFTTSKGDFVPLEPPRALMNKHLSSNRRVVKQTSSVDSTKESAGLFGSVRKLFKKK